MHCMNGFGSIYVVVRIGAETPKKVGARVKAMGLPDRKANNTCLFYAICPN